MRVPPPAACPPSGTRRYEPSRPRPQLIHSTPMYADTLKETLPRVRDQIHEAASSVGRDPSDVTLVAVTKEHPMEAVNAALDAGLGDLGENRVAELEEKVQATAERSVRWHMIGHVQSRKAPRLVGLCHLIHSVDRPSLAGKLSRASCDGDVTTPVLVQINTSGEASKGGYSTDGAVEAVLEVAGLPNLEVRGLMTMAPFVDEESVLRSTFSRLRDVLERARGHDPSLGSELSMGMSNDLRYAVQEGSTMVRIGTALFGPRPVPAGG